MICCTVVLLAVVAAAGGGVGVGVLGAPPTGPCSPPVAVGATNTRLHVCTHNIVRVTHTPTSAFPAKLGLVVTETLPDTPYNTSTTDNTLSLTTNAMRVDADLTGGNVTVMDASGRVLLAERATAFAPVPNTPLNTTTYAVRQTWTSGPDEALYGGGEYQNGLVNWKNTPLQMVQFNTEAVVPFFVSSAGYGLLWDVYSWSFLNAVGTNASSLGLTPLRLTTTAAPSGGNVSTANLTPHTTGLHAVYVDVASGFGAGSGINLQVVVTDAAGFNVTVVDWAGYHNLPDSTVGRAHLTAGTTYTVTMATSGTAAIPAVLIRSPDDTWSLSSQRSDLVDYYVVAAASASTPSDTVFDTAIRGYRTLTGAAPLNPIWTFGFVQCKERYHNRSELLTAATQFRERNIPVDMIVQDWHYWGDLGWGPHWWNVTYPDPASMVAELHALNFAFMVSVWSKFADTTSFYKQMTAAKQMITGPDGYYDPYNAAARKQFYNYSHAAHFTRGVDALWLDATEPEGFPNEGHTVAVGSGTFFMNPYSLMTTAAVADGLRTDYPTRRVFSLTRSSFAGQQRNGAALWSGDTSAAWDMLRRQVTASLNFQASGLPYWSQDIGGFFRPENQYTDAGYADLLTRWFQFGVFTPIFRVHGDASNTELWNYGAVTEQRIVQSAVHLRYRLLPYVYACFAATATAVHPTTTVQRLLAFDFAADAATHAIGDEFMFGPALLVAPVVTPLDAATNTSARDVYLPAVDGGWIDFYTGGAVAGGGSAVNTSVAAPPDHIPVFVRGGSIVPLAPVVQFSREKPADPMEVRVYAADRNATFTVFEDDGVSTATVNSTIALTYTSTSAGGGTLTVGERQGTFPGVATTRVFNIVLVAGGHGVGVSPCTSPNRVVVYNGTAVSVALP